MQIDAGYVERLLVTFSMKNKNVTSEKSNPEVSYPEMIEAFEKGLSLLSPLISLLLVLLSLLNFSIF